jgi:MATE family, multidrug efflux pump
MLKIDRKTLNELVVIAIPMVVSQGAFTAMVFTDRYFMSQISPTHMAAALGGGVASFFCFSFFTGVLSYANALVAQYYGSGQWSKCTRVVTQSLLLVLFCLPLLLLAGWSVGHIFSAMGHDQAQEQLERAYFHILMWGSPIALVKICLASYFTGIGRTKVVMVAETLGVALNIPLSYVLIFGKAGMPEIGIVGAGVGTIISTLFTICLFAYFYFHRSHRLQFNVAESFVIDRGIIKRHLRLGLPSGIEMFLNIAAFNLFLLMFQSYGVTEGASAAIVFNWDMVSFVPLMGINIALMSLIGRCVGAQDMTKVNNTVAAGFLLGLGYSGILAIAFVLLRDPLIDVFISPGPSYQPIHELSAYMMVGLACYVMADAILLISSAVLRGAGDTQWLMITSVTLHWVMLVVQYVVIKVLNYGPRASWIVFVCMILAMAAVFLVRLMGQKWRHPDALRQVLAEY